MSRPPPANAYLDERPPTPGAYWCRLKELPRIVFVMFIEGNPADNNTRVTPGLAGWPRDWPTWFSTMGDTIGRVQWAVTPADEAPTSRRGDGGGAAAARGLI